MVKMLVALLLACASAGVSLAQAQDFPTRPVRVVVPTGPGGGYDFIARNLADRLPEHLGQSIVVENRAGGGGQLGTQVVANSPPDGYTVLVGGLGNMTWVPALYTKVQYDAVADFIPVAIVAAFPFALVARSELPYASLEELLRYAKSNPGKLTIANPGAGTGQHIAAAMLQSLAGIDVLHVSYKSAQQAYPDLLSGRVDLFFDNLAIVRPHIAGGLLRAYAVSSPQRSPLLPNVPAAREVGLDGFDVESWIGLFVPAKTPPRVVERLRGAVAQTMQSPEMRNRLHEGGWRIVTLSSAQTETFLKSEADRWIPLLRRARVTVE